MNKIRSFAIYQATINVQKLMSPAIVITKHAFTRAMQRGITPNIIEDTIQTGTMKKFGKNRVKFTKEFRKMSVNCVDEIIGQNIRIVTITKKVKK